jgi:DNA-binding transcriptional ArsR family regulator
MNAKPVDRCDIHQVHPDRVSEARNRLFSDEAYAALAETFGALSDSNRAKILYTLSTQELCVCDLACVVGISESAVSQHLRILRNLRLVRSRKDGRIVYYSLDDGHIQSLLTVCLEHSRHD